MKMIKYLIGLTAISGISLFGLEYYTEGSYGEIPGMLDQLNPLVEKGEVYIETQKPEEVSGYGTAGHVQKAADANGKERTVESNGLSVLKESHYSEVNNKRAHIETYEEVPGEKVPERALAIIG